MFHVKHVRRKQLHSISVKRGRAKISYSLLPSSFSTAGPLTLGSVVVENARKIYKYIGPSDVVSRETQKSIKIRDKFHVKH